MFDSQVAPDEEKPVELPGVTENTQKPNTTSDLALFPSSLDPSRIEQIQTYIRDNHHADDVLSHVFAATPEIIEMFGRQQYGVMAWPCVWVHLILMMPCLIGTRDAAKAEQRAMTYEEIMNYALSSKHQNLYRYLDEDVAKETGCLGCCRLSPPSIKPGHVNISDISNIRHMKGNEEGGCAMLGCPMPDQIVLTIPPDSELAPPTNAPTHREQRQNLAPKPTELWLLIDPADIEEVLSALQGMKRKFVASKAESGDVAAGDAGNAAALEAPAQQSMDDPAEKIRKLQAMKDEGLLTDEEFAEKKKQIIAKM